MNMRKKLIVENIIKNIILIVLLVLLSGHVKNILFAIDPINADSILLFASLTLVAALFGNFSFTYEFSNIKNKYERFLGHFTTFLLMFAIGLLLEISVFAISIKVGSFFFLSILISVIIYVASVSYDFWDLLRAKI